MSVDDGIRASPVIGSVPEGRRRRSIPSFVWLTTVAMSALIFLGTLILPQLIIPDEKHHADLVLMAREGTWIETGWPAIGDRLLDPSIVEASLSLGPRERALRENRAAQHPPLFYVAAALTSSVATLTVDDPSLAVELWSFRLVSVLAAALLPITFYLIASELTSNRSIALTTAVVPLGVPGITLRDGAMINTDALLILLTSLSVLYAVRVAKGDLSKKTGFLLGVATGFATLTKAHALLMIPVILVAYSIHVVRQRRVTRQWLRSVALFLGASLVTGGWWWIRNVLVHGAVQPVRHLEPVTEPIVFDWFSFDWISWLSEATRRIILSSWGGQYALGGRHYTPLFWILTVLLVVGCVIGWIRSKDRVASFVSALFALILVPAVLLTSAFLSDERGTVVGIQGRYLFPGLAGIAPLVVIAAAGIGRRANRWLPAVFATGSVVMSVLAVRYMLNRYWHSFGPRWDDKWSGVVATSPLPTATENGILLAASVALLVLVGAAMSVALRHDPRSADAGV
jgi:4-amino-4-deoxy-L-arabinose transferase-like glycosyltransferase